MTSVVKKRGRRKKDENIVLDAAEEEPEKKDEGVLKKRGRKPKGGKIVQKSLLEPSAQESQVNVILHLKCSLKDIEQTDELKDPLEYNPSVPPEIMSYNENQRQEFSYIEHSNPLDKLAYTDFVCKKCASTEDPAATEEGEEDDKMNIKDINSKLKKLRIQFYKNTLNDKKSACFWCTYEFDNEPCYIPKYETDASVYGYGCFCRPECAVGYLMRENINDSMKFERYQLLNHIYSKIYGFKKNIKPAPNPYYLLEKFYGTLTIQEYRKLLKTEHMLLVLDRPMTRILPELHDDNDEFILNIYGTVNVNKSTSGYKVKRQSEKTTGPTKNSIIKDKFNLS
jgi:hypothetical protein